MRRSAVLLAAALIAGRATAAGQEALGQFERWGAFRTGAACYAIARPVRRDAAGYVTVASWPRQRLFRQVHVRFAGDRGEAWIEIGARRFPLRIAGADGWPRPADNGAIAAAMRGGETLRIVSIDPRGRRTTDLYPLPGAASAIDAAGAACLR